MADGVRPDFHPRREQSPDFGERQQSKARISLLEMLPAPVLGEPILRANRRRKSQSGFGIDLRKHLHRVVPITVPLKKVAVETGSYWHSTKRAFESSVRKVEQGQIEFFVPQHGGLICKRTRGQEEEAAQSLLLQDG